MRHETCVLLAIHNGQQFLEKQILSLLGQTNLEFDLWILNDASSDQSMVLCRKLLGKFKSKIYFLENSKPSGPTQAFQKLLKAAVESKEPVYKNFFFCDQDDFWATHKIELSLLELSKIGGPGLIHSDLTLIGPSDEILAHSLHKKMGLRNLEGEIFWNSLVAQNVITGCSTAINRDLAEISLPFPDSALMHDHWLGLVASLSGRITYLPQRLVFYRQHSTNASGGMGERGFFKKLLRHICFPNLWKKKIQGRWKQMQALEIFLKTHPHPERFTQNQVLKFRKFLELSKLSGIHFLVTGFRFRIQAQGFIRTMSFYLGSLFWRRKIL
jgi:glycosyltransferase involved in cell wall biosynthesis